MANDLSDKGLLIAQRAVIHQGMGKMRPQHSWQTNIHVQVMGPGGVLKWTLRGSDLGVDQKVAERRGQKLIHLLTLLRRNPFQNTLSEPDPLAEAGFSMSQEGSSLTLLPELDNRGCGILGPQISRFWEKLDSPSHH